MLTIRPAAERGQTRTDWLDSRHTFSFNRYYDPAQMGFRTLRVINDDFVKPGAGFGTHGHRDMEILTWVLDGAIDHKDSMGTGSTIRPGEIQRMTAGTGVTHSEFNHSSSDELRLLQIWILPSEKGLTPGYEQREFPLGARQGRLCLVASGDGRDGSTSIHQDADVYAATLAAGDAVAHSLQPGRHAWIQIARGNVTVNGADLRDGDGASLSDEREIAIRADSASEILLFDLA